MTLFSILCLGFFLGMRHATDADHVVAVTTIVARQRSIRGAAWTGFFWGLGHSLTMLAVGGTIVIFGLVVPKRLGLSLEFSVAVMLIVLGLANLNAFLHWFGDSQHRLPHGHDDCVHGHTGQEQSSERLDRWFGNLRAYRALRPLMIGIVHGLAGSAAVALLVLPVIHDAAWAVAYLLVFGGGTIAGMILITAAMAFPVRYAAARSAILSRYLGGTAGAASFCFGLFLVYQIGFVEKLFIR
jgi:high-affinity nickel-transport protein